MNCDPFQGVQYILCCVLDTLEEDQEKHINYGENELDRHLPFQSVVQLTTNNIFKKMTIWQGAGNGKSWLTNSIIHTWCTIRISTITISSSYAAKTISIPRKQITETPKTEKCSKYVQEKRTGGLSF